MTAVSDSSPLVILSKLHCFEFLGRLFTRLYASTQVYTEVVVDGAGLPGAWEVSNAPWIEVRQMRDPGELPTAQQMYGLGAGEMSTILLGKELGASVLLIDDYRARKVAISNGFAVLGTVGLLESFYLRGDLLDLCQVFQQLLATNVYIDRRLLDRRLKSLGLPPL